MRYTRREFGTLALAGLPAAALLETPLWALQAKPSSKFGGVQIGVITYSYRSMPDQTAQATLKYIVDSGLSATELMDGPVENFLGRPAPAARGGGPGGGRAGAVGGAAPAAPAGPTPYEQLMAGTMPTCTPGEGRGGGARGGGGGGRGRGEVSPEAAAAAAAAAEELRTWRTSVSMDKVKQLRKMFNDAGVTIYAYKSDGMQKNMQTTDAELDYLFNVASALGATHTTMELPAPGPDGTALLKRMAQFAEKHKVAIAYHTHAQGSMTAFDEALAMSKWNMSNVDLGHYVAAGNAGGSPLQFLEAHHGRIASFHLKDRTLPEHCSLTVPFGKGDGHIKDILLLMKKNKWTFPASIELESPIPADSDAVKEVKQAVDFAKSVLA
ncbi:MAG: sugar phosphate isomerase/epimerase [Vicinamibacterales bacterium]